MHLSFQVAHRPAGFVLIACRTFFFVIGSLLRIGNAFSGSYYALLNQPFGYLLQMRLERYFFCSRHNANIKKVGNGEWPMVIRRRLKYFSRLSVYLIDSYFITFKFNNMHHYNRACAAKGDSHESGRRHLLHRTMQRAAVNVYKTDTSYEMLVFAPGRIKEHFSIDVQGKELTISYNPPEGFPRFEWIQREYSRGGFERSFLLNENMDTTRITAKYVDGVLQVTLPFVEGQAAQKQEIPIS